MAAKRKVYVVGVGMTKVQCECGRILLISYVRVVAAQFVCAVMPLTHNEQEWAGLDLRYPVGSGLILCCTHCTIVLLGHAQTGSCYVLRLRYLTARNKITCWEGGMHACRHFADKVCMHTND